MVDIHKQRVGNFSVPDQKPLGLEQLTPLSPINQRYLLVIYIDCYRDRQGRRYVDQLWYKDLLEHLKYLKQFVLVSPCRWQTPPEHAICLDNNPAFAGVEFVDLPSVNSFLQSLLTVPATMRIIWRALAKAEVVHSAIAAPYIPPAWLITPLLFWQSLFRGHKPFYLIIVESAFWRIHPGLPSRVRSQVKAFFYEHLNRWCINHTNLAIFTQQDYQETLLTRHPERGHMIPASWIDADHVLPPSAAEAHWQKKLAATRTLKVLFAGRLHPVKGISTLLLSMQLLGTRGIPVHLDILGDGDLLDDCEMASSSTPAPAKIRLRGTVPYGPDLFDHLRNYHVLVVPSLTDEQPRVVYDAYSQAVPVLASNTHGLQSCVQEGVTGWFVEVGDAAALADQLAWALDHLHNLKRMGMNSLTVANRMTHQEMHRQRWQILSERLAQ
jgi:glycosyltransferase involved in cell wall biosynthesis